MSRPKSNSVSKKAAQFVKDLFKKDDAITTKDETEPAKTLALTERLSNTDKNHLNKYHRADTNVGIMNKFILQMPRVESAYVEIEDAFLSIVKQSNQRDLRDKMKRKCGVQYIRPILEHLGYPAFTDDELKQIFNKDVSSSAEITFKRLLVGAGLCYYEKKVKKKNVVNLNDVDLDGGFGDNYDIGASSTEDIINDNDTNNTNNTNENDNISNNDDIKTSDDNVSDKLDDGAADRRRRYRKVSSGFDVVKKMFDKIDDDGSGEITHSEFKDAFSAICRDPEIVDARMAELDYNKDQEITFREFIFGIASWVGFTDTDESEIDAIKQLIPNTESEYANLNNDNSNAIDDAIDDNKNENDENTATETEDRSFMEKTFEVEHSANPPSQDENTKESNISPVESPRQEPESPQYKE